MPTSPRKFNLNSKTVTAPLAALTMACLLFVYARTSIRAAKRNAQQHREADGGQISWRNESLRRHGRLERPAEEGVVGNLIGGVGEKMRNAEKEREGREERLVRERSGGRGV